MSVDDHRRVLESGAARSPLRVWPLRRSALILLTKGGIVLLVVWSAAGLLYLWLLDDGPVGDADRSMVNWLVDRRTDRLDLLSTIGSGLSDTVVKVISVVVLGGAMVVVWRRWHDAVFLAAAVLFEASVFVLASFIVGRERPDVEQLESAAPSGSFPSGHAAAAVAFYASVMIIGRWHTRNRAVRAALIAMAVIVPIVVAVARTYRGMHHPLDVASGTVLGVASLFVVHAALVAGTASIRAEAEHQPLPVHVTTLDCNDLTALDVPASDPALPDLAGPAVIIEEPVADTSGRTS
jgi:membrane-associated phospholipid phosphatase